MVERPIKKSERQVKVEPDSDVGNPSMEALEIESALAEERTDLRPSRPENKPRPVLGKDKPKGNQNEEKRKGDRRSDERSNERPGPANLALMRGPKPSKAQPPVIALEAEEVIAPEVEEVIAEPMTESVVGVDQEAIAEPPVPKVTPESPVPKVTPESPVPKVTPESPVSKTIPEPPVLKSAVERTPEPTVAEVALVVAEALPETGMTEEVSDPSLESAIAPESLAPQLVPVTPVSTEPVSEVAPEPPTPESVAANVILEPIDAESASVLSKIAQAPPATEMVLEPTPDEPVIEPMPETTSEPMPEVIPVPVASESAIDEVPQEITALESVIEPAAKAVQEPTVPDEVVETPVVQPESAVTEPDAEPSESEALEPTVTESVVESEVEVEEFTESVAKLAAPEEVSETGGGAIADDAAKENQEAAAED